MLKLTKQQLLFWMEHAWKPFLPTIENLSAKDRQTYVTSQGYPRLQDLLAHIYGWWEETIRVVPLLLKRKEPTYAWSDVDDFNAKIVARERHLSKKEAKRKFDKVRIDFTKLIQNLPESALHNERIYDWVYNGVVEHFEEHRIK